MVQVTKMRLPTCEEWDRLVAITSGDDSLMHWNHIFSWCLDVSEAFLSMPASARAVRGWTSAREWAHFHRSTHNTIVGFRPAFEFSGADDLADGDCVVVGNLCLNGKPVKVPGAPFSGGDIPNYNPGVGLEPAARLELRHMLDAPDYKVWAIKAGDVLIADRVLLRNISWMEANVNFRPEQTRESPSEMSLRDRLLAKKFVVSDSEFARGYNTAIDEVLSELGLQNSQENATTKSLRDRLMEARAARIQGD